MLDQPYSRGQDASLPVVVLAGEVDLAAAPSLHSELQSLISAGHSTVVVDLLEVTFLDSIALGVLISALEQCRELDGELHLVLTEPRILRVLEITGLMNTFPIHSSHDELRSAVGEVSRP